MCICVVCWAEMPYKTSKYGQCARDGGLGKNFRTGDCATPFGTTLPKREIWNSLYSGQPRDSNISGLLHQTKQNPASAATSGCGELFTFFRRSAPRSDRRFEGNSGAVPEIHEWSVRARRGGTPAANTRECAAALRNNRYNVPFSTCEAEDGPVSRRRLRKTIPARLHHKKRKIRCCSWLGVVAPIVFLSGLFRLSTVSKHLDSALSLAVGIINLILLSERCKQIDDLSEIASKTWAL
jgi:hypothetical protein